jgi:hypothetical protein
MGMEALRRYIQTTNGRVAKALGVKTGRTAPNNLGAQVVGRLSHSQIMALPERQLAPIQNIDPESGEFGGFLFMAGYDGLGDTPLG